jgi:tetratricopeptide (TPR) repeat protein
MPQGWRKCAVLPGAALVFLGQATGVVAAGCRPSPEYTAFVSRIAVTGLSSVEVRAQAVPNAEIVITATPSAVDVQLLGSDGAAGAIPAADSPVRRFGSRRLILTAGPRGDLLLHVIGKERQGHGSVKLLVVPLAAWRNVPECIEALRRMAAGDAHYARAEGRPGEAGSTSGVDIAAEYQAAAAAYEAAAQALATQDETRLLAEALLAGAAARYQDISDWRGAHDDAARASEAFRRLGDPYAVARATAILADADMELALADRRAGGGPEVAAQRLGSVRQRFIRLAQFHAGRGELFDEALALNSAGLTDYYAGEFARGMRSYRAALPIYIRLREPRHEAQVLQNIALMEYELGRYPAAKRDYARALEVLDPLPNDELPGEILNNQALVEYASGDLDDALLHYGQALSELERLQVPLEVARSLHGLGIVYYAAGDRLRALDYFSRALTMRSAGQDARGRAATLRAMASVLSDLGRAPEAIGLRHEALALAVAPTVRVRIEAQLARDLETTGEEAQAMTVAAQALADAAGTPRSYQSLAFATRAQLEYDDRLIAPAQRDIDRALQLLEGTEATTDQFSDLVLAARIARAHADNDAAQRLIDRALRLAEQMRLETANPELRAGIWQGLKPAFDLKMDLLASSAGQSAKQSAIDQSETAAAMLGVAEAYRARSLADYWQAGGSGSGENDAPTERLRTLYREMADRRSQLETRVERSGEDDPRSRALAADIAALRREADSLHRTTSGRREVDPAAGNRAALKAIDEIIPADSAVVEYWLGAMRARAWVITRQGVVMATLGATDPVESDARALHAALSHYSGSSEVRARLIAGLSRQVIDGLPPDVLRYRSLIIIPDGALHYVPFPVLQARPGGAYAPLIDDHVILTAPSLDAALWHRARRSNGRVLIVSDPVYTVTDPRLPPRSAARGSSVALQVVAQRESFERLPSTAVEAAAIGRMFDAGEVDALSGVAASRTAFLERDLSPYRIIHVATHAITDTEAPLLSALILSTRDSQGAPVPGQVFAGELAIRRLNTELFVLSACDTGLGRELKGEGLLGLRYAAHAAGAESVLASLWPATDRATSDLMTAFYRHYTRDQDPPALALARATREGRTKFADPALWGAFEISSAGAAMFAADRHQH